MKLRIVHWLSASAIALAMASPAWAQGSEGGASAGSDIVVTARRIEERVQDVPISITVFNQEQLANRNVTTAADLVTYTPSLAANSRFGSDNVTFAIRGFSQEIGTQPAVAMYFGDVVAPRGGSQGFPSGEGAGPGSFFDLQNVQVLKGPQGTLFGRNTTGGAVLLVPQKPTDSLEGYVEGSLGNYDMRRFQAVLNVPLADTFRVRLGVDRQKRDGNLKNVGPIGPSRLNDIDYIAVRGSIVADLTPDLENYTIFSYLKSDTTGPMSKVFGCIDPVALGIPFDPVGNPFSVGLHFYGPSACANIEAQDAAGYHTVHTAVADPYSKLRQWQAINTTTWQAGDNLVVKNIISYAEQKQRLRTALFGLYATVRPNLAGAYFFYPGEQFNFAMINPIPGRSSSNQSTFTEELRFEGGSSDGRLVWQGGGYLEISDPVGKSGNQTAGTIHCDDVNAFDCVDVLSPQLGGFPVGTVQFTTSNQKFRNYGLYAQASYDLSDLIKLTGGIRYTKDKSRAESQLILNQILGGVFTPRCQNPVATLPECRLVNKASSGKPTWLVGVDFKPVEDVLLYAKYTRGYRAGGVKIDAPPEYQTFGPEKVDSYEIGLKSSFRGTVSGTFNLAGFYNDFSNQQIFYGFTNIPGRGATGASGPVNAGKSRIYGLEAEASLRPADGLSLDASYAYLNTKIQQIDEVTLPADSPWTVSGSFMPGDSLLLTPKHKLILGANYTLPLDPDIGEISLGVNYTYTARQRANVNARPLVAFLDGKDLGVLPSTNIVNANFNWKSVGGTPVDLSVFITNLTNEKYIAFASGIWGAGFDTATLGEQRMYGVRLRYNFGD